MLESQKAFFWCEIEKATKLLYSSFILHLNNRKKQVNAFLNRSIKRILMSVLFFFYNIYLLTVFKVVERQFNTTMPQELIIIMTGSLCLLCPLLWAYLCPNVFTMSIHHTRHTGTLEAVRRGHDCAMYLLPCEGKVILEEEGVFVSTCHVQTWVYLIIFKLNCAACSCFKLINW